MKCRIDIIGHKIWNDNNNVAGIRPDTSTISLFRNGIPQNQVIVDAYGSGLFRFNCQLKHDEQGQRYIYTVDEEVVPDGYIKTINNYNIINTLEFFTIVGTKIWNDRNNAEDIRPVNITINLLQNGVQYESTTIPVAADEFDSQTFQFDNLPFADSEGVPYVYTFNEDAIANYTQQYQGFTIINNELIIP